MKFLLKKQTLLLVGIAVLIVGAIFVLERPAEGAVCTHEGEGVYSLTYADGKGKCQALSQFKAPVVVINAWASWCPFCVEELPDLATLAEEFPDVPVVAINRGESSADAQEFLSTLSLDGDALHLLYDPEDSFYKFIEGFGMPETIFVDAEGVTLFHKRGIMSLQEMRDTVNLLTGRVQPNSATKNSHLCLEEGGVCNVH